MLSTEIIYKIKRELLNELNKKYGGSRDDLEMIFWKYYEEAEKSVFENKDLKKLLEYKSKVLFEEFLEPNDRLFISNWKGRDGETYWFSRIPIRSSSPHIDLMNDLFSIDPRIIYCSKLSDYSCKDMKRFINKMNKLLGNNLGTKIQDSLENLGRYCNSYDTICTQINNLKKLELLTLKDLKNYSPVLYEYYNK